MLRNKEYASFYNKKQKTLAFSDKQFWIKLAVIMCSPQVQRYRISMIAKSNKTEKKKR